MNGYVFFICLQLFIIWRSCSFIQAASLSINNEFKSGRLLAYKLMCAMTVCRQDLPLTQEYLTHFYRLMHIGLTGTDQVSLLSTIRTKVNLRDGL